MPKRKSDDDLVRERDRARDELKTRDELLKGEKTHSFTLKEQLDQAIIREQNLGMKLSQAEKRIELLKYFEGEFPLVVEANKTLSNQVEMWKRRNTLFNYTVKEVIINLWQRLKQKVSGKSFMER